LPSVSPIGYLMSRRGCSLPANACGLDPHRASISSRFGQVDKDGKPYDKRQKTGGGESTGPNTAAPTVRERPAAAKKSKGKLNHENVCRQFVARAA
jgi:hypothetical protein